MRRLLHKPVALAAHQRRSSFPAGLRLPQPDLLCLVRGPDFLVYALTSNILGAYRRRGIKRPISQEFARFSAILQKKAHATCMQNNRQPLLPASLLNLPKAKGWPSGAILSLTFPPLGRWARSRFRQALSSTRSDRSAFHPLADNLIFYTQISNLFSTPRKETNNPR